MKPARGIGPDGGSALNRALNEYLGELYLQTGQLAKAEERLAVLDEACFFGCRQYDDLKKSIEHYEKRNGLQ